MCDKKSYCNRQIDGCIVDDVVFLNNWKNGKFETLLSCCGHDKYPKTIIVRNKASGCVFEWYSKIILESTYKNGKRRKRFYEKDNEGYYFIPELISAFTEKQASDDAIATLIGALRM